MRRLFFLAVLSLSLSAFAACSSFSASLPDVPADGDVDAAAEGSVAMMTPDDAAPDAAHEASIADLYGAAVLGDQPFVYWRMNDFTGSSVSDSADGGPEAALSVSGDVTKVAGLTNDPADYGASFGDAGAGIAAFDALSALDTTFTFECWVKTMISTGLTQTIFSRYDPSDTHLLGVSAYLSNGAPTSERDYGGSSSSPSYVKPQPGSATLADGAYHHIVVTYDGAQPAGAPNFTLYVDGVQAPQVPGIPTSVAPATPLALASQRGKAALDGTLDEVAIYAHVLTQQQVSAHYSIVHPIQ